MTAAVENLRRLASAPNAKFFGNRPGSIEIPLHHALDAPASAAELQWLADRTRSASPELLDLYRVANGGRLFSNALDPEECFFFVSTGDMESEKKGLEPWILPRTEEPGYEYAEELSPDGRLDLFGPPPWWNTAIVFAGFGYMAERFFLAVEGPWRGQVFAYVHDGDFSVRMYESVAAMIDHICREPAAFFQWAVNYDIDRYESGAL